MIRKQCILFLDLRTKSMYVQVFSFKMFVGEVFKIHLFTLFWMRMVFISRIMRDNYVTMNSKDIHGKLH